MAPIICPVAVWPRNPHPHSAIRGGGWGFRLSDRDMIVPLLALPDSGPALRRVAAQGIVVRRAKAWELSPVRSFAEAEFSRNWADEIACAWAQTPRSVFVATEGEAI